MPTSFATAMSQFYTPERAKMRIYSFVHWPIPTVIPHFSLVPKLLDAIDMENQLSYGDLLFAQILNDNSKLMQERDTLNRDLEASRLELMLAVSAVANEQAARCNVEQAFEAKNAESQNLIAQVATTRKKLIASKDRNKIFYRHNRRLNSKLTEETSKNRRSEMSELQDKNAIWVLENQVNGLVAQSSQMSKELQDIQEKNRQLEESYRNHSYQLITEKDAIARENDTLRSRITELLLQVQDNSSRADMATHQFEEARRGRDRLHDQFNEMKALYNSSVETYKRSAACSKEELEQVKATLEETKLSAQDTQRNLEDELDTLKQAYTECESRLHVALNRLRSIAKDPSEFEVSEERPERITRQDGLSTEKDWEEMHRYFSDLREKYSKTLLENKDMKTMNDDLLQLETATLHEQVSNLKAANQQSEVKIDKLHQEVSTLTHSNEELDRSLQNSTYQLKYLLRDVQNQNKTPPPEDDECDKLDTQLSITPAEAHEKIVFRDVCELQRMSQELLDLTAQRLHDLKREIIELIQLKRSNRDPEEKLSKEEQSCNDKLDSLTRLIEKFDAGIQELTSKRGTLRKVAEDHIRMTSAANLLLRRERDVCKEKLSAMESEMKRKLTEAPKEIESLRTRLNEANEVIKTEQREYQQLEKEASRLRADLQSVKLETRDLTAHAQTAQTKLLDQAIVIKQLEADLTSEKHAQSDLHNQKFIIETQLEQQQQLYGALKSEYNSMKAAEEKLRSLIQGEHADAWDRRVTMDELVAILIQQVQQQICEFAQYKQNLEQAYQSSEYTLHEVEHAYYRTFHKKFAFCKSFSDTVIVIRKLGSENRIWCCCNSESST
ncbi:hypothetical protein BX666DRAFT_2027396 [Dichotomocladium elegans]|nr:hypothetical protein BX666DRAFT_2027396 [Dichotomocladium elegans]